MKMSVMTVDLTIFIACRGRSKDDDDDDDDEKEEVLNDEERDGEIRLGALAADPRLIER